MSPLFFTAPPHTSLFLFLLLFYSRYLACAQRTHAHFAKFMPRCGIRGSSSPQHDVNSDSNGLVVAAAKILSKWQPVQANRDLKGCSIASHSSIFTRWPRCFIPASSRYQIESRERSLGTREGRPGRQRVSDRITCSESKATDSHSTLCRRQECRCWLQDTAVPYWLLVSFCRAK